MPKKQKGNKPDGLNRTDQTQDAAEQAKQAINKPPSRSGKRVRGKQKPTTPRPDSPSTPWQKEPPAGSHKLPPIPESIRSGQQSQTHRHTSKTSQPTLPATPGSPLKPRAATPIAIAALENKSKPKHTRTDKEEEKEEDGWLLISNVVDC